MDIAHANGVTKDGQRILAIQRRNMSEAAHASRRRYHEKRHMPGNVNKYVRKILAQLGPHDY